MLIGVPLEAAAGETRVAVTPETAKKLKAQAHTLRVQSGAGVAASARAAHDAAQSMDVRSSRANITGGKTVTMAADKYQRLFPMLITAAGGGASAPNT